jgi:hypothetical protein
MEASKMGKTKPQSTPSSEPHSLDQARLEIDRDRLRIEEEKVRLERKLINRHFGAIIAALVSIGALVVSVGQIYMNKHLGDQQARIVQENQQRNLQSQQDQIALTRSLKDIELESRATDNSLKLAQFLVDNQSELLSVEESRRKRMESILFAAFEPRVIIPVLERLKGVQFSAPTQGRLENLLNRAKELKVQSPDLQARNESLSRSEGSSTGRVENSTETTLPIATVDETTPRVALVIGNASYESSALRNSVNDARDIAETLRELHFDVTYTENTTQKEMRRTIQAFGEKLREKRGVGLFYYAGHGVQVNGTNYLLPIDVKIQSSADIEYEGVNAGFVVAQMESAENPMNIIILDACRNNSFGSNTRSLRSSEDGLAQMIAPVGTLIAYSTAPGSVAFDGDQKNGLYTQELLRNMRIPGLSLEQVFKRVRISVRSKSRGRQIPWESSSLVGEFYLVNTK